MRTLAEIDEELAHLEIREIKVRQERRVAATVAFSLKFPECAPGAIVSDSSGGTFKVTRWQADSENSAFVYGVAVAGASFGRREVYIGNYPGLKVLETGK